MNLFRLFVCLKKNLQCILRLCGRRLLFVVVVIAAIWFYPYFRSEVVVLPAYLLSKYLDLLLFSISFVSRYMSLSSLLFSHTHISRSLGVTLQFVAILFICFMRTMVISHSSTNKKSSTILTFFADSMEYTYNPSTPLHTSPHSSTSSSFIYPSYFGLFLP